jgi:chromatin segregation and condensation protein Rec8/ScpA/Scc1 (kleisin family)
VNAKTLIAAVTLLLAAQPLLAQNKKVYRCEDGAGHVTYSDEACKGGAELKNDDARTEQQRKAAADVAKREERLGDKLARARLLAEKSAPKAGAALIPYSAAEKAAKEPSIAKTSTAKKSTAKKKKTKPPAAEKTQA